MSTPISAPCVFSIPTVDCDCTYSTVPGLSTATTVATKVGDDFRFYGLRGIGGTTVTQNLVDNTIDIGGGGAATLQIAYNNGNVITTAGTLPVEIIADGGQPALNIHDGGPTGLFAITSTAVRGIANIVDYSKSGLQFNPPVSNTTTPSPLDPYMQLLVTAPTEATSRTDTIVSAANIGAAVDSNDVYRFTPASTPANTVSMFDIDIVGYSPLLGASFAIKAIAKLAPASPSPVLLTSTSNSVDPALTGLSIDVRYSTNTIHFNLIGGPTPGATAYIVRSDVRQVVLTY